MDFLQMAERIGIPFVILAAFGVAVWRVLVWLGEKVVTPITNSHIALVEETKKCGTRNTETLEKMTDLLGAQTQAITKIAASQGEISLIAQKTYDAVNKKVGG